MNDISNSNDKEIGSKNKNDFFVEKVEWIPGGGVTSPDGFQAAGVYCGIKKNIGENRDLALIYSEVPATAAGVFTKNVFQAAPVLVCRQRIDNMIQAIAVNSGNANACVGDGGYGDALKMAEITAKSLKIVPDSVLVSSTGVIGERLPMDKISEGIGKASEQLTDSMAGGDYAAQAILTTDTGIKKVACRAEIGGKSFIVGGIAKGSGMIAPNMATMLAFITTDLKIGKELLADALKEAVSYSFNLISVDGDTSTNDMVITLANGLSGAELAEKGPDYELFKEMLFSVCRELACMIARDGEGITKFITLKINGAPDYEKGRTMALAVLNSLLVKTAFFGEDANWGRIFAALGYSGVAFDPKKVSLYLGPIRVAHGGEKADYKEDEVATYLKGKDIEVTIELKAGGENLTAWGNDLSYDYVKINSDYRN